MAIVVAGDQMMMLRGGIDAGRELLEAHRAAIQEDAGVPRIIGAAQGFRLHSSPVMKLILLLMMMMKPMKLLLLLLLMMKMMMMMMMQGGYGGHQLQVVARAPRSDHAHKREDADEGEQHARAERECDAPLRSAIAGCIQSRS
jgi:hypothetical protein